MMQSIIKEFKGMTDQLVFTNDHLFLTFGRDPSARYIVDLMVYEHNFFVRYLDVNTPIFAAYLPNGDKEGAIEVETFVIDQLQSLDFIWKTEIFDMGVESTRPINHPQDCLVRIDMRKTISVME
ncbi:hypothetical protein OAI_21600 [Vibrio cyclitrophicus FF160]|uniref:hypothetical protein n=1 Tax=Vibrio cyclitrophicus TaxID=47951 RepID=UPI00036EACB0|nr:hypothetical protein [Vibrio cyclitrophicus]OEE46698.1 hypothetical protein OAG_04405 [Vibrio cyclitrophicus FF75]OEE84140.1 hypothetical protein OAI_21600 [Vibrio cyclitrophicus FF160]PMJ23241.1 hypothetical protein BCU28_01765 [Vibrio cyclitrophicus]PMO10460.1 hypothetical protein BCT18_18135 [Vibrio cyclitrophicus]